VPGITADECAAYAAPFPDVRHKAGVRMFPEIVPIESDMTGAQEGRRALAWWGSEWNGPTFMAIGLQDPVLGREIMLRLRGALRGCPEPLELADAGHFVQEAGEPLARAALEAFGD
jgi:pimeloyl-ACP methyl ester carboxylesterase